MLKRLLLSLLLFCVVSGVFASHFRYGLVTATRLSETGTTVTYRINVSEAWRIDFFPASSLFQISGGNTGSFNVPMTTVTDPSGGWKNNSGSATITLNKTTLPTRIESSSCCKISTTVNNHDSNWDEYIILNTNAPGSSPVSTLPAIINMPVNATAATYTIPASDPDPGSTLTYGLPNLTSGPLAGQSEPSNFSINSTTGKITLNTVGKSIGQLYNALVTVTDNNGNQIMLDFIIKIVGFSNPPIFDYTIMPANGFVYNVIAGQNISFPIKATDVDAGSTVGLSVSGLPAYITTSNFSPVLPATGNPSQTTFSWTPAAAQIGTTNILNFIATDNVGVQSTTSVTIRVVAEPAPVFIAPTPGEGTQRQIVTGVLHQDNIVAQSSLGSNVSIAFATVPSGASLSPTVPTGGANPGQTTLNWVPVPADFGPHNLIYQAIISATPTIFATRTYTLNVNTPPVFSSTPTVLSFNAGQPFSYNVVVSDPDIPYGDVIKIIGTTIPSWLTLTSTGNGTAVLSGTPAFVNGGVSHVDLEAEDTYHHGNPATVQQSFDINVITCIAPAIVCPANISISAIAGSCAALVNYAPATTTGTTPAVTYSVASGSSFAVGVTTVTVTAVNGCGTATCSFDVTVTDDEKPTITSPDNISVNNDPGTCGAVVALGNAITGDNCGVMSTTNDAPAVFPVGTTTVTWTVKDIHGNTNTATQTVTVTDNTPPVVTGCPGDISVVTGAGRTTCDQVASWVAPTATDNCGTVTVSSNHTSGEAFPVGTTVVTYTFTDAHSNISTCSFNVTVTDNTAPVVSGCPSAISVVTGAGRTTCDQVVTWVAPTATDNCGTVTVSSNYNSGDVFPVGTTVVTYTFTDAHSNTSTCSFSVTVTDNTAPVVSGCPGNISVVTGAGRTSCDQVATWVAPTATDNCGTVTVSSNHNSGEVFPVGTTVVTYTFTDGHSNTSTCSFNVTIVDNTAPIASCKPVTVTLVNGVASVTAADVNSFSSDNCGPVTIALSSGSKTSYTCADGGKTFPVTLIVTDSHNNVSTCIAQVTVTGEIPTCSIASVPTSTTFTGGNPLNLYLGYGAQSTTLKVTPAANGAPYTYSWSGPVSLLSSSTSAAPVFTPTIAGQYAFTVTTTNKYGCATTCSIIICVTDIRVAGTNGSKVYVCHVPPGNPGNPNTLSISVNAVPAHLGNHAGDRLGSCDQSPCSAGPVTHASTQSSQAATKEQQESNDNEAFTVVVSPNPSTTYFTLKLESKYQTPVSMKVMDANGRVIDAASKIAPNSSIQIGHNYISGSYYAEMIQGNTRKVVQLIKVK